jgi:hypothetical protein
MGGGGIGFGVGGTPTTNVNNPFNMGGVIAPVFGGGRGGRR